MILTDKELTLLRTTIESQSGLDEELARRCSNLVHMGAFDEAVRSAFVLLEEQLRDAVDKEGMTGTDLANYAFNSERGPLAKVLVRNKSEREGLRELYSGAFKLFRNPTAHGVVDYAADEGKAIIGLVNLLLIILKRAGEIPAQGAFPPNLEKLLGDYESKVGAVALGRLRSFLGRCIAMGFTPPASPKTGIPFRKYAYAQMSWWKEPKAHPIAVFYVCWAKKTPVIRFPVSQYYTTVVGLAVEEILEELEAMGSYPHGKNREPTFSLVTHNSAEFFDGLMEIVMHIGDEFGTSLENE